jgi:ribosomal protein L5
MNRYSDFYLSNVRLILLTKYSYKTVNDVENLQRIDLSLAIKDNKHVISSLTALEFLSLKGVRSLIKSKSPYNYNKAKKEQYILKYSIESSNLFYFLENLINFYLPRIRYFKGLPLNNFNGKGGYTFVFKDLLIFPELEEELEIFYMLSNLKLDILIENDRNKDLFFLSLFKLPFQPS